MSIKPQAAVGLALAILVGSAVQAEAGGIWGTAVYDKPAPSVEAAPASPVPAAAAVVAKPPAKVARRHSSRDRIAASRRREASQKVAVSDETSAPTPADAALKPATTSGPIEAAAPGIRDLVTKHARENGVPEKLAAAVVNIESRFNPKARGGSALGLMQIKYDTARSVGFVGGVTALFTPEINLHFGMKVLADAYRASNGDLCMTLARYQSGHRVTHASAANRAYCARAKSYMARAS